MLFWLLSWRNALICEKKYYRGQWIMYGILTNKNILNNLFPLHVNSFVLVRLRSHEINSKQHFSRDVLNATGHRFLALCLVTFVFTRLTTTCQQACMAACCCWNNVIIGVGSTPFNSNNVHDFYFHLHLHFHIHFHFNFYFHFYLYTLNLLAFSNRQQLQVSSLESLTAFALVQSEERLKSSTYHTFRQQTVSLSSRFSSNLCSPLIFPGLLQIANELPYPPSSQIRLRAGTIAAENQWNKRRLKPQREWRGILQVGLLLFQPSF